MNIYEHELPLTAFMPSKRLGLTLISHRPHDSRSQAPLVDDITEARDLSHEFGHGASRPILAGDDDTGFAILRSRAPPLFILARDGGYGPSYADEASRYARRRRPLDAAQAELHDEHLRCVSRRSSCSRRKARRPLARRGRCLSSGAGYLPPTL